MGIRDRSKKLLKFTLDDGSGTDRQILSGIAMYYKPEDLVGKTLVAIVNLPPRKMMGQESQGMLLCAVHKENGEEVLHLLMLDDGIPAGAKPVSYTHLLPGFNGGCQPPSGGWRRCTRQC